MNPAAKATWPSARVHGVHAGSPGICTHVASPSNSINATRKLTPSSFSICHRASV